MAYSNAEYYQLNKERLRAKARAYYAANKEKMRADGRAWRARNRGKHNANQMERHAAKLNATPQWLTAHQKAQIVEIYTCAAQRTISSSVQHDVDHIIPLRGENVCGLHVPWNLQVLPHAENQKKGRRCDVYQ